MTRTVHAPRLIHLGDAIEGALDTFRRRSSGEVAYPLALWPRTRQDAIDEIERLRGRVARIQQRAGCTYAGAAADEEERQAALRRVSELRAFVAECDSGGGPGRVAK